MRNRKARRALQTAAILCALTSSAIAAEAPPEWLFPDAAENKLPPDDGKIQTLPESKVQLTIPQIRDFYNPPDWYPEDHPAPPPLVAHGAKPDVFACGYCHLPTGNGRPENANIAGLPADYIIAQVKDMASGARSSSVPDHFPQQLMLKLAKPAAENPGLADAAAYFAAMKPRHVTRVVETDTVPKVGIFRWMYFALPGSETEPIGERLIELADIHENFEKRDGHTAYTAYVPKGSLARGESLVKGGTAGPATACATCHGPDLKGSTEKNAPPIAGRSPGYLGRQLYDFKTGARNGIHATHMKPVVSNLTNGDLIAITAYLASKEP